MPTYHVPLVGIPTCLRVVNKRVFHGVNERYPSAVIDAAGCLPVLIPAIGSRIDVCVLLDRLDGLLLTGSPSNVHPSHYGAEASHPEILHDPERDATTLPLIREAIRRDSTYTAPRVALGASLLALGKVKEATAELEKAVELSPKDLLPRRELARAYERAGDWPGAVEQYRALRELTPEEPEAVYQLGKAYLRLSEWCLKALKDAEPPPARFYQAQGHTYRLQGQTDLAVRAFQKAAETDPSLPEIHLTLAQLYIEQKRWAEARQEVDRELSIVPDSLGARLLRQQLQALEAKSP